MNQLFRLALAAAAGYVAHRKAGDYASTTTNADAAPTTTKFSARGRFFIGLGVAVTAWFFLPMLLGEESKRSRLSGTARRLLAGRSEPEEDCGCDS